MAALVHVVQNPQRAAGLAAITTGIINGVIHFDLYSVQYMLKSLMAVIVILLTIWLCKSKQQRQVIITLVLFIGGILFIVCNDIEPAVVSCMIIAGFIGSLPHAWFEEEEVCLIYIILIYLRMHVLKYLMFDAYS